MTTYTEAQLINVEWKPCRDCDGSGIWDEYNKTEVGNCNTCEGSGKEPLQLPNEKVECDCDDKRICAICSEESTYRYKQGDVIEICRYGHSNFKIGTDESGLYYLCIDCGNKYPESNKFL